MAIHQEERRGSEYDTIEAKYRIVLDFIVEEGEVSRRQLRDKFGITGADNSLNRLLLTLTHIYGYPVYEDDGVIGIVP